MKIIKNRKGFTLVELLAVIVVLAIVMGISAIAITGVLDSTRKNSFAETAKNYVTGARSMVKADLIEAMLGNEGEILESCNVTSGTGFIIPISNIKLESGGTSPYGGNFIGNSHVEVKVTEPNCGDFEYYIYLEDEKGNSIGTNDAPIPESDIKASLLLDQSKYRMLGYIESTGTQYINTNYIPNNNTKLVLDISIANISNEAYYYKIAGISNKTGGGNYSVWFEDYDGYWLYVEFDNDNSYANGIDYTYGKDEISLNERIKFEIDKYVLKKNGREWIYPGYEVPRDLNINFNKPFRLFNFDEIDDYPAASIKLYGAKIYDNGTLVRDFVPCFSIAENRPGLYDLVSKTFYFNEGSGADFSYPN